jgi:regulator of sigma E protease
MKVILILIVFGVLIIVHELGHFLFAKLKKCKVLIFSIGFGPKIFKKNIGETEFRISLIPFGGYVKLFGESEEEREEKESFFLKPYGTKVLVVLGGALFNFIFALLLYTFFYTFIGEKYIKSDLIDDPPLDSPAYKAGIKQFDKIISYNGKKFEFWEDFLKEIQKGNNIELLIERNKDKLIFNLTPVFDKEKGIYVSGLYPLIPPVAGEVVKNSPAYKAGIMKGDTFLRINGVRVFKWEDMVSIVETLAGKEVLFEIKRKKETISLKIVPEKRKIDDKEVGKIGVYPIYGLKKFSFFKSLIYSFLKIFDIILRTFIVIGGLIIKKYPISSLGGPLLIGKMTIESAKMGMDVLISFVAFISVQLAIINILPIPLLDGGQFLIFTIEKIFKRRFSKNLQMVIQAIGFAIILTLAVFVTFMDIKRILK